MPQPIIRESLVSEVVRVLRASISRGEYGEFLLPERQLSQQLEISRPTLRAALRQLEREGLIAVNARQSRRVLRRRGARATIPHPRIVRMLQNNTPASFLNEHLQTQEFLIQGLGGKQWEFCIETAPGCYTKKPDKALSQLVRTRPASLWILYRANDAMQRWFHSRKLACIVLGSCHAGVSFVSIDQDHYATCRHAAGIFLGRGHRKLAVLFPKGNRPGDEASRAGFLDALNSSPHPDIDLHTMTYEESVAGICKAVNRLLARPNRPTAWLIANPQTCLTVITHLGTLRITIGQDVSLICRTSDSYLNAVQPSIAHYKRDAARMNSRLLALTRQQLRDQMPLRKRWLIPAQFCDGSSVARLG